MDPASVLVGYVVCFAVGLMAGWFMGAGGGPDPDGFA